MADVKISALTEVTSPVASDVLPIVNDSSTKKVQASNLLNAVLPSQTSANGKVLTSDGTDATWETPSAGSGDVVGPATNTANYVPQWDGANSKTLKDGLELVTTVGATGSDSKIPTEQGVREAIAAQALEAGAGDVVGPAEAVGDNFVSFDSTTGKLIKDSGSKAADFATAGHDHDSDYNNYVHPNHSGDVTSVADGATTIANNAVTTAKILDANVTLAKIANIATARLLGRTTAEAGVIEELTSADTFVTDASTTAKGKVELAIASEVNTGTSATLAVTPDALAGSNLGIRYMSFNLNGSTALTTSDAAYQRIPAGLNGMNLVSATASVGTGAAGSSSSGTPTFTVTNVTDSNAMLSTALTVDAEEYTSATAAAAAVIDTTKDDVATDDLIKVACTTAGTGTTYATITLGFQLP
jgi:hypothetical protein